MRRIFVAVAALVASFGVALLASVAASAHTLGGQISSGEAAGYAVTGGQFRFVSTTFTLPDAGLAGDSVGAYGLSVQMRSGDRVAVLGISTCGTSTCGLGGTIVHNAPWNAAVAVFAKPGHALVHSNTASPAMAAGDRVTLEAFYRQTTGLVTFTVSDATAGSSFTDTWLAGPSASFTQVRVNAEFGVDPWADAPYNSPAAQANLALLENARVTSYSGHRAGITNSWWTPHKVVMTAHGGAGQSVNIFPGSVWNAGRNFTVRLAS